MIKSNPIHLFHGLSLLLLVNIGCTPTEISTEKESDQRIQAPRQIALSASVNEVQRSRGFWTEDSDNPILLFHWENDKTGRMKSVVLGETGIKPFTDGLSTGTSILTTKEEGKSQLEITSTLIPDVYFAKGDIIHCFYPIAQGNSTLETASEKIQYTFSTPLTMVQDEANSTRHLSPYIYMKGKGNVEITDQKAFSEVKFNILPAVIQYHITNSESLPLTIKSIRLTGELATKGLLDLSNGTENLSFTEREQTIELQSKLTIQPNQTANFYILLLPTQFAEKEQLVFNMEGTYTNGWTANFTNIPIDCQLFTTHNRFESNNFYTLDIAVTHDEIAMTVGQISIKHAQEGENTQIEIGPKN